MNTPDGLPPSWARPIRVLLSHGDVITVTLTNGDTGTYQVTGVHDHGDGTYTYDLQPHS